MDINSLLTLILIAVMCIFSIIQWALFRANEEDIKDLHAQLIELNRFNETLGFDVVNINKSIKRTKK